MNKDTNEYIVMISSENQIGVLNRVTALFLRRKINIEGLRVAESSTKGISVFVISVFTSLQTMKTIIKQTVRIIEVIDAQFYTADDFIEQEIAQYKIPMDIFENRLKKIK